MAPTILRFETKTSTRCCFTVGEPFNCTISLYGLLGKTLYFEAADRLSFKETVELFSGCFSINSNIREEIKKALTGITYFNEIRFIFNNRVFSLRDELSSFEEFDALCNDNKDPYYQAKRSTAWKYDLDSISRNNRALGAW
ncbi:MAG: hypothetical protein IKF52_01735 [Clostridia bacterium]|nr:hypothetical protein [Clostridia bacterium]